MTANDVSGLREEAPSEGRWFHRPNSLREQADERAQAGHGLPDRDLGDHQGQQGRQEGPQLHSPRAEPRCGLVRDGFTADVDRMVIDDSKIYDQTSGFVSRLMH